MITMAKKPIKKRLGRPPKPEASRLDVRLVVLVTEEADSRYHAAAQAAGLDLSEWIRRACDAACAEGEPG